MHTLPLVKAQKRSVWAGRGTAESRGPEREEPSQQAPSPGLLSHTLKLKRFQSSAPCVCCLSRESSRQHQSPLGFYSCVSGLVGHATALQLSDNPCRKETNTFQYSLGLRSPAKIQLLRPEIEDGTNSFIPPSRTVKSGPSSGLNAQIEPPNISSCFALGKNQGEILFTLFPTGKYLITTVPNRSSSSAYFLNLSVTSVTCLNVPPSQHPLKNRDS